MSEGASRPYSVSVPEGEATARLGCQVSTLPAGLEGPPRELSSQLADQAAGAVNRELY